MGGKSGGILNEVLLDEFRAAAKVTYILCHFSDFVRPRGIATDYGTSDCQRSNCFLLGSSDIVD